MITRVGCSVIRLLCGATANWVGCAPEPKRRIYFANHGSHLDFLLVWASLPTELRAITRPVAGRDYWEKTPFSSIPCREGVSRFADRTRSRHAP